MERIYLMTLWPLPLGTRAEPRTYWRVFAWKKALRKITAVLWRSTIRITLFFENCATQLLFNGQRFEDRFPFSLQEVVREVLTLQFFNFTWCINTRVWTVRSPVSYSGDLFPEPSSLLRVQLPFMGKKHKERKFVFPYFSGWLFSNVLVKLSMGEGFHLWRCGRQIISDHHAQSTTLDFILDHKSNFGKFAFNSWQR